MDEQPLWPFQTSEQVRAWRRVQRATGSDPQHRLDPVVTALEFTRGALGFTAVDRVTSVRTTAADALVGVGWADGSGTVLTVATLRLTRLGGGVGPHGRDGSADDGADDGADGAPWVVTGTTDTSTVFTRPSPGETVTSPLTVAGRLSGVDEALRVLVTGPGGRTLGTAGPLALGGRDQTWTATVPLAPTPAGALLMITVSTGGHVGEVEWFAVTSARSSGPGGGTPCGDVGASFT